MKRTIEGNRPYHYYITEIRENLPSFFLSLSNYIFARICVSSVKICG